MSGPLHAGQTHATDGGPAWPGHAPDRRVTIALPRGPAVVARAIRRFVYSPAMSLAAVAPAKPRGLALMLGWRRVRFALTACIPFGLLLGLGSETPVPVWIVRAMVVAIAVMLAFGLFEQWPRRLPRWLPRAPLQLLAIVAVVPFSALMAYVITTGGDPRFDQDQQRLFGFVQLTVMGLLFAPWIAVAALLKQRDAFARDQALAFERERSELERKAAEARFRLLQAQVEPHFLFNTLANVRALVEAGSPQAPRVLDSLIEYLRAAVPRLNRPVATLEQELQLVRAYLQVMHMRMPDRLRFDIRADEAALPLHCPPMTLLTLVENAVRHGIDPAEEGGRIDVEVCALGERCRARVTDTGVGLQHVDDGLGTGLSTLRERLMLAFGDDAELRVSAIEPHGVRAEVQFPARSDPA